MSSLAFFEGYIMKKGSFLHLWKKRFCMVVPGFFLLKKIKSDLYHQVELNSSSVVKFVLELGKLRIQIAAKGGKKCVISALKDEDTNELMLCLKKAILRSMKFDMKSFEIISKLGRGAFGDVMLCKRRFTEKTYAIKSIKKEDVIRRGSLDLITSERDALKSCCHPFIVELYFAFQNDNRFYFVLEFVGGGELYRHIKNVGSIKGIDLKLYIAEIALALDHMHKRGIIFRDLKSENILISIQGHVKITDFGLAYNGEYGDFLTGRSGTEQYMAPEMIRGDRYNYKVDYWSLGVVAYEMAFGVMPFIDEGSLLREKILHSDPHIPMSADPVLVDLLLKLLSKDPATRMTISGMKKHKFFSGLDFKAVERCQVKHQYLPPSATMDDMISNFDSSLTSLPATESFVSPSSQLPSNLGKFEYIDFRELNKLTPADTDNA